MTGGVLPPLGVTVTGPLTRANPAAKLLAVLLLTLAVFVAIDPVTAAVVLVAELPLLPLTGLPPRAFLRRTWPVFVAAVSVGVANAAFGTVNSGTTLLAAGPLQVTTGGLVAGLGIALRVVAIALPGILALATTDPTDLADSLVQQLRVPPRFAIGALAALRLVPLLGAEWEAITLARRARGVEAGHSPVAALRLFLGQVFTLLVGAIRRGVRLATAMDARGFDSRRPRTSARPQVVRASDRLLVLAAVAVGVAANVLSIALGTWHPLLS